MITYAIHSSRISRELQNRGFVLIKVEPNKKKPQFSVYHFEDTVELQSTLTEIIQRKRKERK